jgi:hypothetical protein
MLKNRVTAQKALLKFVGTHDPYCTDAFDSRPDRWIRHNFASMMVERSGAFKPFDSQDSWIVKYEGRQQLRLIQCSFGLLTESGRRVRWKIIHRMMQKIGRSSKNVESPNSPC